MIYDLYGRAEPSRIYLAKPGKQMVGCLNGIDTDTVNLNIQFINADELSFDIYKYLDGEESAWYDNVDIMMELFVDNYGWYIIDESPVTHNDGVKEYKTVNAKSYEYILHRHDLSTFDVNTASPTSCEMLATDNVYTYEVTTGVWYNLFRDRVLFYRDVSEHDELLSKMSVNTSWAQLQELLIDYPKIVFYGWRFKIPICDELRSGFVSMYNKASSTHERDFWQEWITAYDNSSGVKEDSVKTIIAIYPELVKYIKIEFDNKEYKYSIASGKYEVTDKTFTPYEIVQLDRQRMKDLSLLDLVISDVPGWSIGYVDPVGYEEYNGLPLSDEVGSFEIDSQDVYTFLVNDLSGYFNCIFDFDTNNNIINAYRIESVGEDTNIYLGFRNIQDSVDMTPAQELFTQFTVENSEGLGIIYVNFGEREIEDISYFLNEKYLPQSLIDKYNAWHDFRESKRDDYIQLCRNYNTKYDEASEIKYRVPSDMLNIDQLSGYTSTDQIEEVVDDYYALMVGILNQFIYTSKENITVPSDKSTYNTYDDYIDAMNIYITELETLVDENRDADATPFKDSLYYDDYYMIQEFTIPNLLVTYHNLQLPSYETKQEYYDSFEYDFRSKEEGGYGWLYGIDELKAYQKSHTDKMNTYQKYSIPWNEIPDDTEEGHAFKNQFTEAYYTENHDLYIKYKNGYDSATAALAIRQNEYDDIMGELELIDDERKDLAASVSKENYSDFTNLDLIRLSRLIKHTDYVNDNILYLENIDTSSTIIDKHKEMYDEAVEQLYAESHPQYMYTTNVNDLLANNEYEEYTDGFKVGNFIRIGLDDDTFVKLRLTGIVFNPMTYDQNMELTYSNMIRYKKKRNDFVSLLNSAITSAKNQLVARYEKTSDANGTIQVTYDLVQKILQSSSFTRYAQNIQSNSVSSVAATFNALAADYIKTEELAAKVANIDELNADSAFIKYLEANLVVASEIDVNDLKAKLATIDRLDANSAFVGFLETEITASRALFAESASISDLSTRSLNADSANIATLATESLSARSVGAENIDTTNLTANDAIIQYLEANLVAAKALEAHSVKAENIDTATITASSAFAQYLQSVNSTAISSIVDQAYIRNLVAGYVTVADLAAGDITLSNGMRIVSENGMMVMNGTALQIYGTDENDDQYVGIQLGYDTNSNPSLILKNSSGATVLTPEGITTDAIADGLIINNMISNGTISKDKLGFSIMEPNQYGGIDITQVYDGSGGVFGVEYTSFKTTTNNAISVLDDKIDNSATYTLYIDCPNGTNIRGQNIVLNARLFKNSVEVTDEFSAEYFTWSRQSSDYYGDLYWNNAHQTGTKSITITASDVQVNANFECVFEYGDTTVVSE